MILQQLTPVTYQLEHRIRRSKTRQRLTAHISRLRPFIRHRPPAPHFGEDTVSGLASSSFPEGVSLPLLDGPASDQDDRDHCSVDSTGDARFAQGPFFSGAFWTCRSIPAGPAGEWLANPDLAACGRGAALVCRLCTRLCLSAQQASGIPMRSTPWHRLASRVLALEGDTWVPSPCGLLADGEYDQVSKRRLNPPHTSAAGRLATYCCNGCGAGQLFPLFPYACVQFPYRSFPIPPCGWVAAPAAASTTGGPPLATRLVRLA